MSADIIDLPVARVERSTGNGAREALINVGELCATTAEATTIADRLLIELWVRGFKVVPVDPHE